MKPRSLLHSTFSNKRASGILLHITSLPSQYGIGDLGPRAYQFADFLASSGQAYWQVLPLNPTDVALANSPYSSCSAFAGSVLMISPDFLVRDGFITREELGERTFADEKVDYLAVALHKVDVLYQAFYNVKNSLSMDKKFQKFRKDNQGWLEDYSLFVALKERFEGAFWGDWPEDIRKKEPQAVEQYTQELSEIILREAFFQYLFYSQWFDLKKYVNKKGIQVIGDAPIYVQHDSVDVWANPEIFKIDDKGCAQFVAGVPPDYFSKTGQLWGNPVYDWDVLKKEEYGWWKKRLEQNFSCFDIVRIDHFRGFVAYWEVPASENTAVNGKWVEAPVRDFFDTLLATFKNFPIIAEDLGVITDDVKKVIKDYGFPGMKILQFAFDSEDDNPYLPANHIKNCIIYTGTHDNNTSKGWFKKEASRKSKDKLLEITKTDVSLENVSEVLCDLAMKSIANSVIIPLQDVLGLDESARMNTPGTISANWEWRLLPEQLTDEVSSSLASLTADSSR